MTRRLILIRHAKSSWDDPFGDDHTRTLNKRGVAAAKAVGEWLADKGHVPDLVLCSDAKRTQETAALILPSFTKEPALRLVGSLYHASPETIFSLIKRQEVATLAIIAHNPGIGMLANAMIKDAPDHHRFSDYPTCATSVINFEGDDWSAIERHSGHCVDFIVPRDLIGTAGRDAD